MQRHFEIQRRLAFFNGSQIVSVLFLWLHFTFFVVWLFIVAISSRAAVACLGEMYEKLGRVIGRSYEETVQILSKSFRNLESQLRIETMQAFEKVNIVQRNKIKPNLLV